MRLGLPPRTRQALVVLSASILCVVVTAVLATGSAEGAPLASGATPKPKPKPKATPNPNVFVLRPNGGLRRFIRSLRPGDIGKLAPGTYGAGTTLDLDHGGSAGQRIRVTSLDPSHPATILARIVTKPGGDYWTLDHLNIDWVAHGQNFPSITIGSDHTALLYDDIQNHNTSICINVIRDSTWGVGRNTLIDHNRIHNCGLEPLNSFTSPGYFSHGIYVIGENTTITNNYIYDNSNRGIQLRGSTGAVVEHNTIDGNGSGIIFGDLAASNNLVAYNIITNSSNACRGGCNAYGAFSWWGSTGVGSGNAFHDNCVFGNQSGDINVHAGGFVAANNKIADPRYVNRGAHQFALRPGSPCTGYGVDGAEAQATVKSRTN